MIKIDAQYTDYFDGTDPAYPGGKAVDTSNGDSEDGTPYKATWMNDINGFHQAAIVEAKGKFEVSNTPDKVGASEILKALKKITNNRIEEVINTHNENAYAHTSMQVTIPASSTETEFETTAITDTLLNIFLKIRQGFNWLKSQFIPLNQKGASNGVAPLVNGKLPTENMPSVQVTINRTISLNDNSTNTEVLDTGAALTIPLAVQSLTTPSASSTQLTSGTKTLRNAVQTVANNIAHLFTNKANNADLALKADKYPIGTYYTQYPLTGQSTIAGMFPLSESPATLFGGTWTEQYGSEEIFFKAGVTTLETNRGKSWAATTGWGAAGSGTIGIEIDANRNITGSTINSRFGYPDEGKNNEGALLSENNASMRRPSGESSSTMGTAKITLDASKVVPTDTTNHPRNRLIKVWKKTAN